MSYFNKVVSTFDSQNESAFGAQTSSTIDVTPYEIFVAPGETLCF